MEPIKSIDIHFLGERDFPSALAKLQGPVVEDFPDLLVAAQAINPIITIDEVMRQVIDLGKRKLRANIARGILQEPRAPDGRSIQN